MGLCDPKQVRSGKAWYQVVNEPGFMQGGKTGWPPGLLQDDDKRLSKWFASKPDAREVVRRVAREHERNASTSNVQRSQ